MQNFRSVLKTNVVICIVVNTVLFLIRTGRERFIPSGQRLNGSTYLLHVKCPVILWSSEFSTLTFQRNSMKCSSTPPSPHPPSDTLVNCDITRKYILWIFTIVRGFGIHLFWISSSIKSLFAPVFTTLDYLPEELLFCVSYMIFPVFWRLYLNN